MFFVNLILCTSQASNDIFPVEKLLKLQSEVHFSFGLAIDQELIEQGR